MDFNGLLLQVSELGASDVHLKLGQPPLVRRDGAIESLAGHPPLTEEDLDAVVALVTRSMPDRRSTFDSSGELDVGYESAGARFRINAFRQRGAISVVCRLIPRDVPTFETLHMPPGVRRLAEEHRGLVLVTGRDRLGQVDHARGDARPHQPHAPPAHHHDRGPDRDAAPGPGVHRQPARGRDSTPCRSHRRFAAHSARTPT